MKSNPLSTKTPFTYDYSWPDKIQTSLARHAHLDGYQL